MLQPLTAAQRCYHCAWQGSIAAFQARLMLKLPVRLNKSFPSVYILFCEGRKSRFPLRSAPFSVDIVRQLINRLEAFLFGY